MGTNDAVMGNIICEAVHGEVEFKPIAENKNNGYIIAEGIIQTGNDQNRNKRYYPTEELALGINSARTQELVTTGNFKGEAGHPLDKSLARQSKIDPRNEQVWYQKLWMDGDNVMAHFRGTNNELGKSFNADLKDGQRPSFSLRALGALINENGKAVVKNLQIITYDRVYFPSHKQAYTNKLITSEAAGDEPIRVPTEFFAKKEPEIKHLMESGNDVFGDTSFVIPMTQKQINNFIVNESCNVRSILNTFDVFYESVSFDPMSHMVTMKTKLGDTINLSLETTVSREIIEGINDLF